MVGKLTPDNQLSASKTAALLNASPWETQNELLDGHRGVEPPDPIPNSEVKPLSADGSVGSPHVRVGHC